MISLSACLPAARRAQPLLEGFGGDAHAAQQPNGRPALVVQDPEQDVLGPYAVVPQPHRFPESPLQDLLRPRRERDAASLRYPRVEGLARLGAYVLQGDPDRSEHVGGHPLGFLSPPFERDAQRRFAITEFSEVRSGSASPVSPTLSVEACLSSLRADARPSRCRPLGGRSSSPADRTARHPAFRQLLLCSSPPTRRRRARGSRTSPRSQSS